MNSVKKVEDLSDKIKVALDKAIRKVIEEEKARKWVSCNLRQKRAYKKSACKRFITLPNYVFFSNKQ
jgi:hypothetical protein